MTSMLPDTLAGDYTIDPAHSRIGFVARHAMVTKVRGGFNSFSGSLHLDPTNPESSTAEISIDVESIDTRQEQRDGHLRANEFFDAGTYPKITFKSTSVKQVDSDNFEVVGDLTIKDVTKLVTVDFEFGGLATDPFGNERVGFEGKASINRSDYNVKFNAVLETGGVMVSEKVQLEFDISAIRNKPTE